MVVIRISSDNDTLVMKLVEEILTFSDPTDDGLLFHGQDIFAVDDRLYVLGDLLSINKVKINNDLKRGFIREAINRFKDNNVHNYSYFKRALKNVVKGYFDKEVVKYEILFSTNIEFDWIENIELKDFNNLQMTLQGYQHVKDNYLDKNKEELEKKPIDLDSFDEDFSYFILDVYDRDANSAFNRANCSMELFRGFFNISEKGGKVTWQFGTSQGDPFSDYGPSKDMLVFNEKQEFLEYYFRVVPSKHEIKASPFLKDWDEKLKITMELIERFDKANVCEFKDLIGRMIRSYNLALDQTESHFQFLHLWQIIENIFKENSNEKFGAIISRIKNMCGNDELYSKIINILFKKRNMFVHDGDITYIESSDVTQIKNIVDSTLIQLIYNLEEYKTKKDLIYFFDNVDLSFEKIDQKINALERIKKLRTK